MNTSYLILSHLQNIQQIFTLKEYRVIPYTQIHPRVNHFTRSLRIINSAATRKIKRLPLIQPTSWPKNPLAPSTSLAKNLVPLLSEQHSYPFLPLTTWHNRNYHNRKDPYLPSIPFSHAQTSKPNEISSASIILSRNESKIFQISSTPHRRTTSLPQ